MPLNAQARAQAIVSAIMQLPATQVLSSAQQNDLMAFWQAVIAADTTYLTQNATINPGSLAVAAGVPTVTNVPQATYTGQTTGTGQANVVTGVVAAGIAGSVTQPASSPTGHTTAAGAVSGIGTLS